MFFRVSYINITRTDSYPNKERLDHAVGFPVLWMATITVNGSLNDSHNVVTKIPLKKNDGRTHREGNCRNSLVQGTYHKSYLLLIFY